MQNQTACFYPKHTADNFQAAVFVCGKKSQFSANFIHFSIVGIYTGYKQPLSSKTCFIIVQKGDWVMDKKILSVFIIHNVLIFAFLIIDKDLSITDLLCLELALYIIVIWKTVKTYPYYLFCVFIPIIFICSNHLTIFENWNKDYSELVSFSGETFYPDENDGFCNTEDDFSIPHHNRRHRGKYRKTEYSNSSTCNPSRHFLYLQSENQKLRFSCDKTILYGCNEINDYFDKGQWFNLIHEDILFNKEQLSIKYTEQSAYLAHVPFFVVKSFTLSPEIPNPKQGVIYEIAYQGKVIYDYNYFISKYKRQRYKYILYAVYLILNSICFIFIYRSVFQKLSFYKNRIDQ